MRLGFISKTQIAECLADQLGIPMIKLSNRHISERVRALVPGEIAKMYRVIPVEERADVLLLAGMGLLLFTAHRPAKRTAGSPVTGPAVPR